MTVTIELPDELADRLTAEGEDPRRFAESAVAAAARARGHAPPSAGPFMAQEEPAWVAELVAATPNAGSALRQLVGSLADPEGETMSDAEALALLQDLTRDKARKRAGKAGR